MIETPSVSNTSDPDAMFFVSLVMLPVIVSRETSINDDAYCSFWSSSTVRPVTLDIVIRSSALAADLTAIAIIPAAAPAAAAEIFFVFSATSFAPAENASIVGWLFANWASKSLSFTVVSTSSRWSASCCSLFFSVSPAFFSCSSAFLSSSWRFFVSVTAFDRRSCFCRSRSTFVGSNLSSLFTSLSFACVSFREESTFFSESVSFVVSPPISIVIPFILPDAIDPP